MVATDMNTKLKELAAIVKGTVAHTPGDTKEVIISGVSHNSAWVQAGDMFVAIRGKSHDGHRYIPGALARGAVAVVGEGYADAAELPVPYVTVPHARKALADIAALLNGYPSHRLTMVGVTGTKGKTTTSWLIRHLIRTAGYKTGLLSTLGYKLDDDNLHQFPAHFTTPEAPQVQATLAQMVDRGCTHAVIEASSEALAQNRLRGAHFEIAVWTNLAPEHLNFHGDMESYFSAKRILIDASAFAVLNAADTWAMRLTDHPHVTYSSDPAVSAHWLANKIVEAGGYLTFHVRHRPGSDPEGAEPTRSDRAGSFAVQLPLIGAYNTANALAAIAVADRLGIAIGDIRRGLSTFPGVPGRMQIVQEAPVRVILDFAHTPESLWLSLTSLRATTRGRLTVVFGAAGGQRDPRKRAPMGAIATELADTAVFTEEDCRDTPIYDILNEMKRGADEACRSNYILIPNRREAIHWSLSHSGPGDTVVFCGKAGEITLERADEVIPWIEETIVREILQEIGNRSP